jgi:hypothetical protein
MIAALLAAAAIAAAPTPSLGGAVSVETYSAGAEPYCVTEIIGEAGGKCLPPTSPAALEKEWAALPPGGCMPGGDGWTLRCKPWPALTLGDNCVWIVKPDPDAVGLLGGGTGISYCYRPDEIELRARVKSLEDQLAHVEWALGGR